MERAMPLEAEKTAGEPSFLRVHGGAYKLRIRCKGHRLSDPSAHGRRNDSEFSHQLSKLFWVE